ncbi:PREDICTED: ankyrin repeat domain-containing protein 54-like isoform X2 [Habropoda laboriosa]|uniref:ankyrin repeat domain-containing protein 54-like isoform X2 n=1 Tax=Habropoda laboriosa TaxID=597456 RepID=UPI00083D1DC7|nr:PREDICTED: ankyrin repeat domain-containing protein 54-like isoform X2 [Habropoda laboriosa]
MTSMDSGIETSNNSDDDSIAQNEDISTNEINVSSAFATTSSQNDICEIEPNTSPIKLGSFPHPDFSFPISSLGSFIFMNENRTYPRIFCPEIVHEVENSTPTTSSSGPIVQSIDTSTKLEFVPDLSDVTLLKNTNRRMKSLRITHRNERRMRIDAAIYNTAMMERIVTCGISNTCEILGRTPFNLVSSRMRIAAATNNTPMIRRLLSCRVTPNNCDTQGRTPLHLASSRGYAEIVRLLLQNGADPNLQDCVGNNPLHLASATYQVSVLVLLLNAGTNLFCSNHDGHTPIQLIRSKLESRKELSYKSSALDRMKIREEIHLITKIMVAYVERYASKNMEPVYSPYSRLPSSSTTVQVLDDVKELLSDLDALSLTH